jgi:RNA recognition motif-containing protein
MIRGPREEESDRTIFVNGLCYETTEPTLKAFFSECGEVL